MAHQGQRGKPTSIRSSALALFVSPGLVPAAVSAQQVAAGFGHVAVLDAPVSGGVAGAKAGTLSFMASGDPAAFAAIRLLLETIGRNTSTSAMGWGRGRRWNWGLGRDRRGDGDGGEGRHRPQGGA